jgi:cell wall-associated NlpC family hydrolase
VALATTSVLVGVAMATPASAAPAASTAFVAVSNTELTGADSSLNSSSSVIAAATALSAALHAADLAAQASAWRTTATYLSSDKSSINAGASVSLTGRVTHGANQQRVPAQAVKLQVRSGGTWRTVATKWTSRDGYAVFTVRPGSSSTYRLVYAGVQPLAASTSDVKTVSVTAVRATTPSTKTTTSAPSTNTAAVTTGTGRGAAVVAYAASQSGKPYSYGSAGPNSYDCSGLTQWAFKKVGVNLPHNADAQSRYGQSVSRAAALPGDLVIFVSGGHGYHAGIYAGNGYMYDAPHAGTTVGRHQIWGSNVIFRRLV